MKNYKLKNQEADETIHLVLRRHWMFFAAPVIFIFFSLFVLLLAYSLISFYYPTILEPPTLGLIGLIIVFYLIFLNLYFFLLWTDYYLDNWIVTNKRILDIEQLGLFKREVSEFKIYRVQDVTVEIKGIIPTFLNYGHVHIQTAGSEKKREIVFKQVPNPYRAKDVILKLHSQAYQKHLTQEII